MSMPHRTRLVNPRLGTYFGIFASAFAALFLTLLILEQLNATDAHLRALVLLGPIVLFVAIGVASSTVSSSEFFAAGRRVPAAYNGLAFAIGAIGGTGLVSLTGLFFLDGFDTWFLAIGISSGFLVMGIAISPYLRKYGAYTIPSYLARRFESRLLRVLAALLFAVPMVLLLAAEIGIAVHAAALLTGYSGDLLAVLVIIVLASTIAFGGMRAVGWVSTAQAIAAIISILVLAAMIGVMLTNLPLAQLSYGPVLRKIGRLEEAHRLAAPALSMFDYGLAGQELRAIGHGLAAPFVSVGWGSFIAGSLVVMMGIAGAPWLLPRCATTLGVYEARKSLGWAIFFTGVIILTLSAIAVLLRAVVMEDLFGPNVTRLPAWFVRLRDIGLTGLDAGSPQLPLANFLFARDGILYSAPVALQFPVVVSYLVLAGAIAAALGAAGATAFALSAVLAEDVLGGLSWEPANDVVRTHTARIMLVVVLLLGLVFYAMVEADPLELFLSALAFSAATSFPVVALSIWWKSTTIAGAVSGMLVGFATVALFLLANAGEVFEIAPPLAGLIAAILAFSATIAGSILAPVSSLKALEVAREIRIPGGETIYDREIRQKRFSQRNGR